MVFKKLFEKIKGKVNYGLLIISVIAIIGMVLRLGLFGSNVYNIEPFLLNLILDEESVKMLKDFLDKFILIY